MSTHKARKPAAARAATPSSALASSRRSVLTDRDWQQLRWSFGKLEHPSLAARLSDFVGAPIEGLSKLLPAGGRRRLARLAEFSVRRALDLSLISLGRESRILRNGGMRASGPQPVPRSSDLVHKALAGASGAAGGLMGPVTLALELPLTTVLMLRSIADIARSEGEDLSSLESRLACVQVFALGGRSHEDDATDTGYYGLRAVIGLHFAGMVERAVGAAPAVPLAVTMVRGIASRFGIVVSDKAALQMVPLLGAASGALVNIVFMQHFQDVARGHFIVRRLERVHGSDAVRQAYARVAREQAAAAAAYSRLEGW